MAHKRLRVTSSVLLYVLLGLPVWWHVTSIHRPPIPQERIAEAVEAVRVRGTLLPSHLMVYWLVAGPVNAHDTGPLPEALPWADATHLVEGTAGGCVSPPCLNLTAGGLNRVHSLQELDALLHRQLQSAGLSRPGLYVLFILPRPASLPEQSDSPQVVVGEYRHAWVYSATGGGGGQGGVQRELALAAPALKKMLGRGKGGSNSALPELPISAASQTVLSFSLCNADPTAGFYTWRFAALRRQYLQPLLDILAPVVQLAVHSQVLYHTPTPAAVKWSDDHAAYLVKEKELPFFVDSNWNLDSGRSVIGTASGAAGPPASDVAAATTPPATLHMVVFIPPPAQRPLRVRVRGGALSPSNSFWIPSWGGVVILNPDEEGEAAHAVGAERAGRQHDLTDAAMQHIAGVLVSHLHSLLGLTPPHPHTPAAPGGVGSGGVLFLPPLQAGFSLWSVEALLRRSVAGRVAGAALTLQSLARLVRGLHNLEMPDLIGDQVWRTLEAINSTLLAVEAGSYWEASAHATRARGSAEVAFSHPSVLAQLNFPESHKLGVYMPYFLPAAVPLLQALAGEGRRALGGRARTAAGG